MANESTKRIVNPLFRNKNLTKKESQNCYRKKTSSFEILFILNQDWDLAPSKTSPCRDAPVTKCAKCIQDWDMSCDYSCAKYTKCVGDWDIRRAQLHQCWRQKIGCAMALLSRKRRKNVDAKKMPKALLCKFPKVTPKTNHVFRTWIGETWEAKPWYFSIRACSFRRMACRRGTLGTSE